MPNAYQRIFSVLKLNKDKPHSIVAFILVAALMIDTMFSNISDLLNEGISMEYEPKEKLI